ncbi:hypothetical protein [Brevundimonas sp.]|uniref:hypothetical protein n=1 Tax=Brevundimonas sp. TaxID=1871086 RepID=UPI0025B9867A|nr:hypothetical protein [Brevundimonas sp.]MCG2665047.1 hypothetical protein [Brevundimonas sp.]
MQTAQQRISAITNKHLDNNLSLAGMYGLQGSDKAQFDLARNQIKDVLRSVQQRIDPTLALIVRDNDWYWYLAGGLNFAIYGGKHTAMGHFWLDEDGTVYAGGMAFPKDGQGAKVGTAQGIDADAVESYVLDHLEQAVGL